MSKSVTKAWIVAVETERNRMIPRFSFIRSGGLRSFVTDLDITVSISPRTRRCQPHPQSRRSDTSKG